eukprot:403365152
MQQGGSIKASDSKIKRRTQILRITLFKHLQKLINLWETYETSGQNQVSPLKAVKICSRNCLTEIRIVKRITLQLGILAPQH